jgi:DNA-binding protein HU-beta
MTKAELIDKIAKRKTLPNDITKKTVTMIVDSVFDEIKRSVKKEGKFAYPHFGTFAKKKRKARKGVNPRTKTAIKIPARTTVVFRAHAVFKEGLGGTFK